MSKATGSRTPTAARGASGAKLLITTATLVATIGSWAAFAAQGAPSAQEPLATAAPTTMQNDGALPSVGAPLRVVDAAPIPITRTRSSR